MKCSSNTIVKFAFVLVLVSLMFGYGASDVAKDKQECTDSLIGMATCLPYVGGNAKAPTPDCCNGLKQVLKTNKKCLCLIIKDRNDPDLGLAINVTLALGLPAVCNAPANISQCPALLHLDPNSPDAQIFYQNGHQTSNIAGSPASSPTSAVASNPTSSPLGASPPGPSAQQNSDGSRIRKHWFEFEAVVTILLLWSFTSNLSA